jgi:hypothetical protein
MEAFEISTKINNSTYEGADLIEPFETTNNYRSSKLIYLQTMLFQSFNSAK